MRQKGDRPGGWGQIHRLSHESLFQGCHRDHKDFRSQRVPGGGGVSGIPYGALVALFYPFLSFPFSFFLSCIVCLLMMDVYIEVRGQLCGVPSMD